MWIVGFVTRALSPLANPTPSGTASPSPTASPSASSSLPPGIQQFVPTDFWQAFLLSPGAVGAVALLAAIVTLAGIHYASKNGARDRAQKEQADFRTVWWDRAEWGLEKALSTNESVATVGYEFLEGLMHLIKAWGAEKGNAKMADLEARLLAQVLAGSTHRDLDRAVEELGVALEGDTKEAQETGGATP